MSRPRVGSDHYPLILDTSLGSFHNTPVTRFEKVWAEQDDLNKAITRWWNSLPGEFGTSVEMAAFAYFGFGCLGLDDLVEAFL